MTFTPEHLAKLAAAKRGRTYSAEHRAAISAGLRRAYAAGKHSRKLPEMTDAERADYQALKRKGCTREEALQEIFRGDHRKGPKA